MENKITVIIFALCFIFNTLAINSIAKPVINGLSITNVEAPGIVICAYSNFYVNVTVKNDKSRPLMATVLVFLQTMGKKSCSGVVGVKRIMIRANSEMKIRVECTTGLRHIFLAIAQYKRFITNPDKLLVDGQIGVAVYRGFRYPHQILSRLSPDKYFSYWQPVILVWPLPIGGRNRTIYEDFIFGERVNVNALWGENKLLRVNWIEIPEKTDKNGNFQINLSLSNIGFLDLNVIIEVSTGYAGLFGTRLPAMITSEYMLKLYETVLPANSTTNLSLNCSFPKYENLLPNYYDITVAISSYIPVKNNINWLGELYWIRYFLTLQTASPSFRKSISSNFFSAYRKWATNIPLPKMIIEKKIYLGAENPTACAVQTAVDVGIDRLKNEVLPIFFSFLFIVIVFAGAIYWILRKKT